MHELQIKFRCDYCEEDKVIPIYLENFTGKIYSVDELRGATYTNMEVRGEVECPECKFLTDVDLGLLTIYS